MNHDRPTAAELFDAASRLGAGERADFLESRCGDDTALRSEVESLLAHYEEAGDFLENTSPFLRSLSGESGAGQGGAVLSPGAMVGHYKVLGVLGEGGMGMVYLAQQHSPRREVALKLIRPGIASPGMLRRFEHEGQLLGRLQHPGIAQIFEAGVADVGFGLAQPFFAMELVKGVILTQYAELKRLTVRERLDLFVLVADAVQHAHHRGLIHRDLKPGNILVNSEGQPKVLDFGIARATDSDIQATTIQTDVGQLVGTLPYMSPEQVAADPLSLDTRSDVYALGVVLYELLTGRLPHDVKRKMIPEAVRIIRDTEPTRLSSIDRIFRGDIETIVGKALEKDRDRRYQSASELADDIRRFLRDEPVVARPPSRGYQLQKFAKRNKAIVAGVAAVFLVLVLGVIGTSIGMARAMASEDLAGVRLQRAESSERLASERLDRALASEKLAGERARQAERQSAKAGKVADILQRILRAVDPEQAAGREVSVREVLDNASSLVRAELVNEPDVAAEVNLTLAEVYGELGLMERATGHLEAAMAAARTAGPESAEVLARALLGSALQFLGRDSPDPARAAVEEVESLLPELSPDGAAALELVNVQAQLAEAEGRNEEAEWLYREAARRAEAALGPMAPATLVYKSNLSVRLGTRGQLEEALVLQNAVLEGRLATLGRLHPETAITYNNLGSMLRQRGRYTEAESMFREALSIRELIYDEDHPYVAASLNSIAATRRNLGDRVGAEPLYRRALAIYRKRLGPAHPRISTMLQNLASLRQDLGDLDEAQSLYDEALAMQASLTGGNDLNTAMILSNLATLQSERGDMVAAEASARRVLEIRQEFLDPRSPQMGLAKGNLAYCLIKLERYDEAEYLLEESLSIYRDTVGERHPYVASALRNRSQIAAARREWADSEAMLRQSLEIYQERTPNNVEDLSRTTMNLATAVEKQGRREEAEAMLLSSYEQLAARPELARWAEAARVQIEALYRDWGRADEADAWSAAARGSERPGAVAGPGGG